MLDTMIDDIYRAGFERQRWPGLLAQLAEYCGSHLAYFHAPATPGAANDALKRYVTHNMDNDWLDANYYHYAPQDPFTMDAFAAVGHDHSKIIQMMAARPGASALQTAYYQDYCRAMDIGDVMTVMLEKPTSVYQPPTIGFGGRWGSGAIDSDRLDRLSLIAPHLRRVGRLMFDVQQVDPALQSSIELLPHAVFLLRENGTVISANERAETVLGPRFGLSLRHNCLMCERATPNTALQGAVARAVRATVSDARIGGEIDLEGEAGEQATLIIMPLGGDNPFEEQTGPCRAIAYVLPHFADPALPGKKRLGRLYGLTEAEVDVALALVAGHSPEEISVARSRSMNTVRTQIRNILSKTQRHRTSDLRGLLRLIELP